jgi:hypothetical protein
VAESDLLHFQFNWSLEALPGPSQCLIFSSFFSQGVCFENGQRQISFHESMEQDWWVIGSWTFDIPPSANLTTDCLLENSTPMMTICW